MCGILRKRSVIGAWLLVFAPLACGDGPSRDDSPAPGSGVDAATKVDGAAVSDAGADASIADAAGADTPIPDASSADGSLEDAGPYANTFTDPFDAFDTSLWACEYSCPTIQSGVAAFSLLAGVAPDKEGSWSKIRYEPRRFTSGRFTVRFALTARPARAVWWGIALWNDGPSSDASEYDEINFGYTTDESFTSTQLLFESAKRGHGASIKVDTGADLYDGAYHTGALEYDASHVALSIDGVLLHTITDTSVIPTDAMDFIIGPRLVTGSAPLEDTFVESVDSARVDW